jgi:hypothetical protein
MMLVKAVFQADGHWSFHVHDDAYQRVVKLMNISEKYMQCIKLPLLMSDLCEQFWRPWNKMFSGTSILGCWLALVKQRNDF